MTGACYLITSQLGRLSTLDRPSFTVVQQPARPMPATRFLFVDSVTSRRRLHHA